MNYEEYRDQGEEEYDALSEVVRGILQSLVNDSANGLRCQPIQNRAKALRSLKKKLEARGLPGAENIEEEIKDLAGCRMIFYTNPEVDKFQQSRLIADNFDVDWEKLKIHGPIDDDDSQYMAIHYTVRLNAETLAQEGMGRFAGMLCEIQVQTILDHAWAETTRDIIYKSPSLEGYGTAEFQSIERRLNKVMTDYLQPAGYEFQKAQQDFENLITGKSTYESGSLDQLKACEDNNQRHELLERFRDYVLPNYDDIVSAFPEVRQQLVDAIRKARNTPAKSIETPFGNFEGKSEVDVSSVALDILERLRYIDVEQSFVTLCEIYSTSTSEKETKRLIEAAERLASHDLLIWNKYGPVVQRKIVEQIKSLKPDLVASVLPLVAAALSQVLSAEAESTKSGADAITIQRAAILPSPELKELREEAIRLLTDLYETASDSDKRLIRNSVWSATRTASYPPENEELDVIILENRRSLVEYFTGCISDENFEVLQGIEHKVYWLKKHSSPWAEADKDHPARSEAAATLLQSIENFRDAANNNEEYEVYKVLVGYESVFPPAWDDEKFKRREEDAYRKEELGKFVADINSENADVWRNRIERCAAVESRDLATFLYFVAFLSDVAAAHPEIALGLVSERSLAGVKFLPSLYGGLQKSAPAEVSEILMGWCRDHHGVEQICRAIRFSGELDMELLSAAAPAALEANDRIAVSEIVAALFSRQDLEIEDSHLELLRRCIRHMTGNSYSSWVHEIWAHANESKLLKGLNKADAKLLLENLVHMPQLEYHAEAVLGVLLGLFPEAVVGFFGDRVRYERTLKDKNGYSAIPYKFYEIAEKLQPQVEGLVELGEELFAEDGFMFEFRGGRLISITYPTFTPEFEEKLTELVATGDEQKIDFVLHILRNYKGQAFLQPLRKEIVNALEPESKLLNSVGLILESMNVVSGEYGMRDYYIAKKAELQDWLTDEREKVREFAKRERRSLDRQIAAEQRQARERLELRKLRKRDYEGPPAADDQV